MIIVCLLNFMVNLNIIGHGLLDWIMPTGNGEGRDWDENLRKGGRMK